MRPVLDHHGVPPYPPIGPQTGRSVWRWHYEKQWHQNRLQDFNSQICIFLILPNAVLSMGTCRGGGGFEKSDSVGGLENPPLFQKLSVRGF